MKVGIVGFSQSGKSTLFEALTGVKPDPSATMKGQIGVAKVTDPRVDFLSAMYHPKKTTHATVEFIDTPGLIRGQQADNSHRLATLRNADGMLIVLSEYTGNETAADQLRAFRDELLFADLQVITNRIEKLQAGSKRPKPAKDRERDEHELAILTQMSEQLEEGAPADGLEVPDAMQATIKGFQLFCRKPEMIVCNRAEDKVAEPAAESLLALNRNVVVTAAKLELDLEALEGEEREMFMEELGVEELAREQIIKLAYDAVGLISFFTVGDDECKAWTIAAGTHAVDAAGKIHTDIARGFIRAEVVTYDDLHELGSMKEIKAKGLGRLEGKDYVVADGDIINFRFSV